VSWSLRIKVKHGQPEIEGWSSNLKDGYYQLSGHDNDGPGSAGDMIQLNRSLDTPKDSEKS
jgi:hypothetical protein